MTNINSGGRTPVAGIIHAVVLLILLYSHRSPVISLWQCWQMPCVSKQYEWVAVMFVAIFKGPKGDSLGEAITFLLTVLIDLTVAIGIAWYWR